MSARPAATRRTRTTAPNAGTTRYTFDDRGLLTQVDRPDASVIQFAYDGLGVRKRKTVKRNGTTLEDSYYVTANLFGFSRRLASVAPNAPTQLQTATVYGGHQPLLAETGSARSYLVHEGSVGSVTHASDDNGSVQQSYAYDAFGAPRSAATAAFGYTGEEYDEETGLLYLRARYYDPQLGRFVSADPFWGRLEEPASQNRYVYAQNNPVRYADPSGLERWQFGVGGHLPLIGGAEMGVFVTDGAGDVGGNPDFGVYLQGNKPYGGDGFESGVGRLKLGPTIEVAQGGRGDALKLDAELYGGAAGLGVALGGLSDSRVPTSVAVEGGVIFAAGADLTVNYSLSVGDIGRLAAAIISGDFSQRIMGADSEPTYCKK